MKQLLPLVFSLYCLSAFGQRQNVCTQQFADFEMPVASASVISETKDIVSDIMNVTGLKAGFALQEAKIPNAAAVIYNGNRYVLYNPAFIQKLNQLTGNDWASVSVLAHEIGHHLNGHTLSAKGSEPAKELEADEFSGYIMQRLGASLEEAQTAMKLAADIKGSTTHPGRNTRLYAIERGWNNASEQLSADIENAQAGEEPVSPSRPVAVVTRPETPVVAVNKPGQTVIDDKFIAADIFFREDPTGKYYITVRGNVVCVKDNRLFLLGEFVKTAVQSHPYIINNKGRRLFVDRDGTIFTASGTAVGSVKDHG